MSLAVVFPGQGSQRVGMGRDWTLHPAAEQVFAEADKALGFSLSALCFDGPEEELKLTANQQPAILATSWAIYQVIEELLPPVAFYAGHSLGEYTALVAAGALPFAQALNTVRERGRLMQEAVPAGEGAMAAVIGLAAEQISEINSQVVADKGLVLDIANLNSPDQIVVSGDANAVAIAMEHYQGAGAKRVVELPVSAPFHSALMVPAADALKPRLMSLDFTPPQVPVIANLTVQPYPGDPAQCPLLLHAQIFNPVRWAETLHYFVAEGVTRLLEVGPGKVLRMLAVKTTRELSAFNIEHEIDREKLASWLDEELS